MNERAENHKALQKLSRMERFALMFGVTLKSQITMNTPKEIRLCVELRTDGTTAAYTADTWDRQKADPASSFYNLFLYIAEDGSGKVSVNQKDFIPLQ